MSKRNSAALAILFVALLAPAILGAQGAGQAHDPPEGGRGVQGEAVAGRIGQPAALADLCH